MSEPLFLPFVRRGLARAITTPDPLAGPLDRNPEVVTRIELRDNRGETTSADRDHRLVGPGDVTALDPSQILRMEPAPGTDDAEPNYFAQIELAAPELPWLLTPAAATAEDALRPWLVLVVVAERDEVAFAAGVDGGPDTLTIDPGVIAEELWHLDDSWAWAHVQATCPASEVASRLDDGDGTIVARLMCPRRLRPARTYRAALVPAFDIGVDAALGIDTSEQTTIDAAWRLDQTDPVVLPVYASWTFGTADVPGDFEQLCERLAPDSSGTRLGYRDTELDTVGLDASGVDPDRLGFEYAGALASPGTTASPLDKPSQEWLTGQLTPLLDRAASRQQISRSPRAGYRPERDDPVVGPPLHGAWAADTYEVPTRGWLNELNLTPVLRAAAGLGARVVRRHQHELLAGAWDQVGSLRRARVELQRTRLAAEVTRVHAERLAHLDDATLLFTVGASAAFRPAPTTGQPSVKAAIRTSEVVPTGAVSSAFYRQARAASPVGRTLSDAPEDATASSPTVAARAANTFLAVDEIGLDDTSMQVVTGFRVDSVPDGTFTGAVSDMEVPLGEGAIRSMVGARRVTRDRPVAEVHTRRRAKIAAAPMSRGAVVVGTLGGDVRAELDASVSIAAGLDRRVGGLDLDVADRVPTKVIVGPWFPDGLEPWLRRESPELVLPGVSEFEMNRVRLLGVNEDVVAAFLVGANHEWAREALWNEFPADLAATAFASFFDRPGDPDEPGPDTDLSTDIHNWSLNRRLSSFVGGKGSSTVILLRAQLVRRYPDLIVSLLEPDDGNPPVSAGSLIPELVTDAAYRGRIDRSTIFVGFDVDPDVVLDDGWFVAIEEHPSGPRFGLDVATGNPDGSPPAEWEELNWRQVNALDPGVHHIDLGRLASWNGTTYEGVEWGRNGAHHAAITFQRPFRMIFPATSLLGGAS